MNEGGAGRGGVSEIGDWEIVDRVWLRAGAFRRSK